MNTCQTVQLFSLTRQIKPGEEVAMDKLLWQDNQAVHKCKDTSFINLVITKRLFQ